MKKCPYCAEEIQDEAIFCRFCQHDLRGFGSNVSQGNEAKSMEALTEVIQVKTKRRFELGRLLAIGGGFFILLGAFLPWFFLKFAGVSRFITGLEEWGIVNIIGSTIILCFSFFWQKRKRITYSSFIAFTSILIAISMFYKIWFVDSLIGNEYFVPQFGLWISLLGIIFCFGGAIYISIKK